MSIKTPEDCKRYLLKARRFDNLEYEWTMPSKVIQGNKRTTSSLHATAKGILITLYPRFPIYEEVRIDIEQGKFLYLDLYVKHLNLALEVHGAQHYKFNSLFHRTRLDFARQRYNDTIKEEWCKFNDIGFLALDYKEIDIWEDQIKNYEYK